MDNKLAIWEESICHHAHKSSVEKNPPLPLATLHALDRSSTEKKKFITTGARKKTTDVEKLNLQHESYPK